MARTLYRSVRSPDPTDVDFMSYGAQGKLPPRAQRDNPEFLRKWDGLSVFTTYAAARQNALMFRWRMGEFIAELEIPDDAPVTYETPDHRNHLNVYDGDPVYLRSHVTRVVHGPTTPALD